jgi:hypothetical protein
MINKPRQKVHYIFMKEQFKTETKSPSFLTPGDGLEFSDEGGMHGGVFCRKTSNSSIGELFDANRDCL